MTTLFKTLNILFTLALAGVGGLLLVSVVQNPWGIQLKIVQSGSMEPTISVGSVILIRPVQNYQVGDVITFGEDTAKRIPTTHRIKSIEREAGSARFITKGDANEEQDQGAIAEREIIGKVVVHAPYVGYVLHFARTKLGFALLVGIPAVMVVLGEALTIIGEVSRARRRHTPVKQPVIPVRSHMPKKPTARRAPSLGMDGVLSSVNYHASKSQHYQMVFR